MATNFHSTRGYLFRGRDALVEFDDVAVLLQALQEPHLVKVERVGIRDVHTLALMQ